MIHMFHMYLSMKLVGQFSIRFDTVQCPLLPKVLVIGSIGYTVYPPTCSEILDQIDLEIWDIKVI